MKVAFWVALVGLLVAFAWWLRGPDESELIRELERENMQRTINAQQEKWDIARARRGQHEAKTRIRRIRKKTAFERATRRNRKWIK